MYTISARKGRGKRIAGVGKKGDIANFMDSFYYSYTWNVYKFIIFLYGETSKVTLLNSQVSYILDVHKNNTNTASKLYWVSNIKSRFSSILNTFVDVLHGRLLMNPKKIINKLVISIYMKKLSTVKTKQKQIISFNSFTTGLGEKNIF